MRKNTSVIPLILGTVFAITGVFVMAIADPFTSDTPIKTSPLEVKKSTTVYAQSYAEENEPSSSSTRPESLKYDTEYGNIDIDKDCETVSKTFWEKMFNTGYRKVSSNSQNYEKDIKSNILTSEILIGNGYSDISSFLEEFETYVVDSKAEIECSYSSSAEFQSLSGDYVENGNIQLVFHNGTNFSFFEKIYEENDIKENTSYDLPVYTIVGKDDSGKSIIKGFGFTHMTTKEMQ